MSRATAFFIEDGQRVKLTGTGLASGYDIVSITIDGSADGFAPVVVE